MKIVTENPLSLLIAIKEDVKSGAVPEWVNTSGFDFTHASSSLRAEAWICGAIDHKIVIFTVLMPSIANEIQKTNAIYYSEFIRMLLTYYQEKFTEITICVEDIRSQ